MPENYLLLGLACGHISETDFWKFSHLIFPREKLKFYLAIQLLNVRKTSIPVEIVRGEGGRAVVPMHKGEENGYAKAMWSNNAG